MFLYEGAEGQPSGSHNVPDGAEARPRVLQAQRGAGRTGCLKSEAAYELAPPGWWSQGRG